MFKEIRKKNREIGEEDIKKIIYDGEYGVLATLGENGYPYAVPLSYVYLNEAIYFHCAIEGSKLENIMANEKVSFCIVGKTKVLQEQFSTEYESVIVFGRASLVKKDEKRDVLIAIAQKYSPNFMTEGLQYIDRAIDATCIVKIEIDRITGKARR